MSSNNRDSNELRPILRWAGSKKKSLPVLSTYWRDSFNRYIEPFAGSAALFFRLRPNNAILSDINSDLIETYTVLRDQPDRIHAAICSIPRTPDEYYKIRSKNKERMSSFNRAVRFIYLNRNCFNGIHRTNRLGEFNVPFAHSRPGAMPTKEEFRRCSLLLQNAKLSSEDFGAILTNVRKNDFVYLDPPYAVENQRIFSEYGKKLFTSRDLTRLNYHLDSIDRRGAYFVVSYAKSEASKKLFERWDVREVSVRRNVAGFVGARRSATELVATNILL